MHFRFWDIFSSSALVRTLVRFPFLSKGSKMVVDKSKKKVKKPSSNNKMKKAKPSQQKKEKRSNRKDEEIQVDFDFFNMDTPDFHSIKLFLNVAFGLNSTVDTSQLAGLITDDLSEYIGNTAKTEGEESDALGFTSIIPLSWEREKTKSLTAFYQNFMQFDAETTALVLHERVINLPPPVALQLFNILLDDFANAQSEHPAFKNVSHIIISTPTLKKKSKDDEEDSDEEESDISEEEQAGSSDDRLEHEFPEADLLDSLCEARHDYKVPTSHETGDSRRLFSKQGVEKWRSVYKLSLKSFKAYISKLNQTLND